MDFAYMYIESVDNCEKRQDIRGQTDHQHIIRPFGWLNWKGINNQSFEINHIGYWRDVLLMCEFYVEIAFHHILARGNSYDISFVLLLLLVLVRWTGVFPCMKHSCKVVWDYILLSLTTRVNGVNKEYTSSWLLFLAVLWQTRRINHKS